MRKKLNQNQHHGLRTLPLVVALLAAASTVPVVAAGPGWTANSTVKKLVITFDGGVNVLLSRR